MTARTIDSGEPVPGREDLARYCESTRYALTWDDVRYRERTGNPYPRGPAPTAAAVRASIERDPEPLSPLELSLGALRMYALAHGMR